MVILRVLSYTLIVAALLFGLSGSLDWAMAWISLCVLTTSTGVNIYFVAYKHPGLVAERTKSTKGEGILTHGSSGAELPMSPGLLMIIGWAVVDPSADVL